MPKATQAVDKTFTKETQNVSIDIMEVKQGDLVVRVIGNSPLVLNRLSEKAKHELLNPHKKTAVERQISFKHIPVDEFRASAHKLANGPSLLAIPSTAFKGALATAALDLPGTKAQIARLSYVNDEYVHLYGIPKLYMAAVRNGDMNHTPDIRTRCIIPEWAAEFVVTFAQPMLTASAILRLIAASGVYIGVGDGRPEKGKLSFGRFRLGAYDDPEYARIVESGGRATQIAAMDAAEPYDEETAELLTWYSAEVKRRANFEHADSKSVAA